MSAPNRTSFNNRMRHILNVMSNYVLVISTGRNPVPRAHFILGGTLRGNLHPVIIVGGVSHPRTRPRKTMSGILSLFLRLNTSSSRYRFPCLFTSNVTNFTGLRLRSRDMSVRPLFRSVLSRIPPPINSISGPLRLRIAALSCSRCLNQVIVNGLRGNAVGTNRRTTLVGRSNDVIGSGVAGLLNFRKLHQVRVRRTSTNRVITITNFTSTGVNRAVAYPGGPRTLPLVGISRPALRVAFIIGSSPFTKRRNAFIASQRLHSHLVHRLRAGITLQMRPASSPSHFTISNHNRLRLNVLVRAVHQRNCRFRISRPRIVCQRIGNRPYRPCRLLVLSMPRSKINNYVRHLNRHQTRLRSVQILNSNHTALRFIVPTQKLINFHNRFVHLAHNRNVVGRDFLSCQPLNNSVRTHHGKILVTFRRKMTAFCTLGGTRSHNIFFVIPNAGMCGNVVINRRGHGRSLRLGVYGAGRLAGRQTTDNSRLIRLRDPVSVDLRQTLRCVNPSRLIRVAPRSVQLQGMSGGLIGH